MSESNQRLSLTPEQKLAALAARFYQGLKWHVNEGDYYTSSRNDLELYRVVKIEGWKVFTEYCTSPGKLSEWDLITFDTGPGFGMHRVWVPEWVFEIKSATDEPSADLFAVAKECRANGYHDWANRIERAAVPPAPITCGKHGAEYRMRHELPCPWCVIDELKTNRDRAATTKSGDPS